MKRCFRHQHAFYILFFHIRYVSSFTCTYLGAEPITQSALTGCMYNKSIMYINFFLYLKLLTLLLCRETLVFTVCFWGSGSLFCVCKSCSILCGSSSMLVSVQRWGSFEGLNGSRSCFIFSGRLFLLIFRNLTSSSTL